MLVIGFKLVAGAIASNAFTGVAIGVGFIFASLVYSISRNPSQRDELLRFSLKGSPVKALPPRYDNSGSQYKPSNYVHAVFVFILNYSRYCHYFFSSKKRSAANISHS